MDNESPELKALKNVVSDLESWCDEWHANAYTDPRISLRSIANRAKASIPSERDKAISVLNDLCDKVDIPSSHYNTLLQALESLPN